MAIKKEHRIFLIQAIIAIVLFLGLSVTVINIFSSSLKAELYLKLDKDVKEMSVSSTRLLDALIAKGDLTFEPTKGTQIHKVLKNLKYAEGNKLLMIGSSQLRVLQGENINIEYQKLVSRKITTYTNYNTYNLSLGGMKTSEKLIIAEKGIQVIQPTRILISATPWDCVKDEVRPTVKSVENEDYEVFNPKIFKKLFPLSLNDKIRTSVDKIVENNIDIYNNRGAIKYWLYNEITGFSALINEEKPTAIPEYWRTLNQKLDNSKGWDKTEAKTGRGSLKIINEETTSARWLGDDIVLEEPTDTFEFSGWSKAKNVSKAKLYCLNFQVFFEDGTSKWHFKGLQFNKGTHDWEKVKTRVRFDKKVTSIKPHILFYNASGTVWFDDIAAKPVYDGKIGENILPNPDFEAALKERLHVSYTYDAAEWKRIQENMFSLIDFLSKQETKAQNVLLFTPFWHNKDKTAYPQKAKYKALQESVKHYCKEKNVAFVDASYLLSKENFGIYTKGSVRDKIDVLHFNADGHEKLATYIIKELKL
ncbi:hypothetical protein H2O64_11695 [Kordia sp. YSTF-M3]|uniref:SGNH hydrolase-type esterase domain-containing protein n=1 Tax=Kordia aestuariivivens TaxID=2759037 RepID=A0ABR7Q9V7_9FLAO|nr:hypothetical protein [Kordia aestuariivivens]MBC8755342.1 hypothetical protein [Kordia aestuariivivens]